jgi:type IV secretion system protein VirB11
MMTRSYAPSSTGLLEPLKKWLDNPGVSEILVNKPCEVFVEESGKIKRHSVKELNEMLLERLFLMIANENQQEISERKPLLSGSLLDGSRVQLVLPPTAKHHTLSIRRKVVRNFEFCDYQKSNFFDVARPCDIAEKNFSNLSIEDRELIDYYNCSQFPKFLEKAISYKKNIIISGGTSSGKTTFLNACLRQIPRDDRIIILEDTREIDIPHENKVQLLASKGGQCIAKVNMQDLVQSCLRLRPDRIIVGETRGAEILDFISACSTGHEGSLTSIHANSPRVAFMRMTQMYKLNNVPSMTDENIMKELKEVIDVIIQVSKSPNGRQIKSIYFKYGDFDEK